MDVTVQKNILDLLKEIQSQRNMGMIFISHDLGIIKNIANQVLASTFSRKKIRAPKTTNKGADCKMAVAEDMGVKAMAKT